MQRFFQISFWVAESWLLVVPIALLWMYDFMRRQQSNKRNVVHTGYSTISGFAFVRLLLLVVVYLMLYLGIWYGDIADKTLLNHLLLGGAVVYSGYFLRQGRDWQVAYAATAAYAFFLVAPELSQDFIVSAMETAENRPLAIFAGLFAYLGWRETAMATQVQREEAMRNRLNGLQGEQGGVQMTITYVRISEAGGMFYKLFRYFMLTPFRGTSYIGISTQEEEVDIDTFGTLDEVLLVNTQIVDFYKVKQGEYKLITEAVTLDSVQSEFYKLVRSIGSTYSIQSHRETTGRFGLDLGRRIKPQVRYTLPQGVIPGFLIRNEFSKIKSLRASVSLEFNIQRLIGRSSGLSAEAPLICTYDEWEVEYYRTWRHLLKINVPSRLFPSRLDTTSDGRRLSSHRPDPMFQGLQMLEECYKNIDINGVAETEYADGTPYQYLRIQNENTDVDWREVNVPVTNYRPPDSEDRIVSSRIERLLRLDRYSFDAEAILYEPNPEADHGKLSAVYGQEPRRLKVTWKDIEDRSLAESPVRIERAASTIHDEGVIWKRE